MKQKILNILHSIMDPEVPVLSVMDLGIIRDINCDSDKCVIKITPTYTACPAMDMIKMNLHAALNSENIPHVIETVLTPPWTTDWMSEEGKQKLKEYGIAAPVRFAKLQSDAFGEEDVISCPRCNSNHTSKISEFGSTACKALYKCLDCKEPFDYFKCH